MNEKIYIVRLPVEITREGFRKALIKSNRTKEAANEILLDKMLYMTAEIHRVSLNKYFRNEDGVEMSHLQAEYIKKNLGQSGGVTYKQVIDFLILVNAIEVDDSYFPGNYSKGYGIKNRSQLFHIYKCELKYWQPQQREGSLEETEMGMNLMNTIVSNISKVEVDREYIWQVNMHEVNLYAILNMHYAVNTTKSPTSSIKLKRKDILDVRISSDEYGRVHHNITSIGRKYRPALSIDGEDIYSTDLSASQMYFALKGFISYAKSAARTSDWKNVCRQRPDVPKFIDAVLNGHFYATINECLNFSEEELKANKIKTLMPLFSKKDPKRRTKFHKALDTVFPTFMSYINTKKKKDYADAAKYLQLEESSFMIKKVCKKLTEMGVWYIPIHDCILSKKRDVQLIRNVIEQEGISYNGFKPHMKITNWTGAKENLRGIGSKQDQKDFQIKNISDYSVRKKQERIKRIVNENKRSRKQKSK